MTSPWKNLAWFAMAYFAILTGLRSTEYVTGDTSAFHPLFRDKYSAHLPIILTHGVSAITILLIGPSQFLPALRRRFLRLHRILGRLYMIALPFAGVSGFIMGSMAYGGLATQALFCPIAAAWLVTGWKAYAAARARNISAHQNWMIRNYALTFGAVTLRLYLAILQRAGLEFEAIYPYVVWAAWIPNIALAEYLIRRPLSARSSLKDSSESASPLPN